MLKATFKKHILTFKIPGGTSRGVLRTKTSWYLVIWEANNPEKTGIGECGLIPKLSFDDRPDFEKKLIEVCRRINEFKYWLQEGLIEYPAIRFGLETAMTDLQNEANRILFPSDFTSGIDSVPINGLIWMGTYDFMRQQIIEKIEKGFRCLKLKIGAIDFNDELRLLKMLREDFTPGELELRLDANGAFGTDEALEKLKQLSDFEVHSIEQPIKTKQWEQMSKLCQDSPLSIALDEELIGVTEKKEIRKMFATIRPDFIILKPGLLGGFKQCEMIIRQAKEIGTGWWITSALEGNIGLNAIAQWTYTLQSTMPQGLGTGQLFTNNIPSPLETRNARLFYNKDKNWKLNTILDD